MSHSHSKRFDLGHDRTSVNGVRPAPDKIAPSGHTGQAADRAIDSALRAVPLPVGLMTRLGLLAYTMPDDMPDQVDWLGC